MPSFSYPQCSGLTFYLDKRIDGHGGDQSHPHGRGEGEREASTEKLESNVPQDVTWTE